MENNYYPFKSLPLPYNYNALEPFIDEKTMYVHHSRHLQAYINNLNALLEKHRELQGLSLTQLIRQPLCVSGKDSTAIKNNAGGVFNHRFFFNNMTNADTFSKELKSVQAIEKQFGDIDMFKKQFKDTALSVFGSGYAWLINDRGRLKIVKTANQDTPISQNAVPLMTVDVWEHAYYLKHLNLRGEYLDDWFNVINWNNVESNYIGCKIML
ncbi:MAG: superoxide dismutase [Eubacterium sp.]